MYPRIILLLFFFTLIACQSDQSNTDADPSQKVYRHSIDGKPSSLDPIQASTVYSNFVVLNIFDTLYTYKYLTRPYEVKPNLAAALPEISMDGLRYIIRIKPGVYFHDHPAFQNGQGRELEAEDFVYSIKRMFDPDMQPAGSWLWQGRIVGLDDWKAAGSDYAETIEGLKALDRYSIQITLNKPFPQLLYTLTLGYSAVVPHEVVMHEGSLFGSKPIGSGPFTLNHLDANKAYLLKHSKFRQEPLDLSAEGYDEALHAYTGIQTLEGQSPPFVDRLEIHFMTEQTSQWNSFVKGDEIQFARVPKDKQNTVILSKDPFKLHPQILQKYHHSFGTEAAFVYGGFNMDDPNFGQTGDPEYDARSKALRCAIRSAHDWKLKNQNFYFGLGTVFPGIIPPMVPEYDPDIPKDSITTDIKAGRILLQEAGWHSDNLPTFEYHTSGSVSDRLLFEQMRGFLKTIDYPQNKIEYHPYASFGSFNQAIKNKQAPFFYLAWFLDYPDAENTLQLFYGPNASPGSNTFNYKNPEFDRLFKLTKTMQPSEERTALYQKMNQMIIDDCVVISGLSRKRIFLWHKNVIMFPDREILGGAFLRYVDIQ
ncbi:ABC transporter substrate-binding protein [Marinicella sp. W31]|uniref:ABC transporter substrate-binding protein n=1 Tax=Marinicella sp. W31 TaxID=3023713 RepID=UPI0037570493